MRDKLEPCLFGIVIYDGVEPIDIGGTVGVVSMAQRIVPAARAIVIASEAGPVRLAGGLTIMAEAGFADAPVCDFVVICGGPGWRDQVKDASMLSFLAAGQHGQVASVCTGALILAAAGVLDGRCVTTRRSALGREESSPLDLISQFAPSARPLPRALVDDHGLVTGGGVSLAIDATLYLLGRLYGEATRDEIARTIEYDRAYAANLDVLSTFVLHGQAATS